MCKKLLECLKRLIWYWKSFDLKFITIAQSFQSISRNDRHIQMNFLFWSVYWIHFRILTLLQPPRILKYPHITDIRYIQFVALEAGDWKIFIKMIPAEGMMGGKCPPSVIDRMPNNGKYYSSKIYLNLNDSETLYAFDILLKYSALLLELNGAHWQGKVCWRLTIISSGWIHNQ